MNDNVAEIISILMRKILDEDNSFEREEDLVRDLLEQGYLIEDIDAAFQLVFFDDERVIDLSPLAGVKLNQQRKRVITREEQSKLSIEVLEILEKIQRYSLLDLQTWEYLFLTLFNTSHEGEITTDVLWVALEMVLEEEDLGLMTRTIPELKKYGEGFADQLN